MKCLSAPAWKQRTVTTYGFDRQYSELSDAMKRCVGRLCGVLGIALFLLGCGGGPEFKPTVGRNKPEEEKSPEEIARMMALATGQPVPGEEETPNPAAGNSGTTTATPAQTPTVANPSTTSGPDLSTLLPPSENATTSEPMAVYSERMQKIGEALIGEINETGFLPNPQIMNSDGEPGLSWRVRLLPALGHKDLYDKFRLDESWDSPHNIQLLPFMPAIYRSGASGNGKTCFQVPAGPRFAFPGDRLPRLTDVTHGIGATVILVQTNDQSAVPWTAPEDYRPTQANGASGLAVTEAGTHLVLWGSGQVRELRTDAGGGSYICMLTISGPMENWSPLEVDAHPPEVATVEPTPEMEGSPSGTSGIPTAPGLPVTPSDVRLRIEGFALEHLSNRNYQHVAELLMLQQLLMDEGPSTMTHGWLKATNSLRGLPRIGVAVTCPLGGRITSANPVRQNQSGSTNAVYRWDGLDDLTGDLGQSVINRFMERMETGAFGSNQLGTTSGTARSTNSGNPADRFLAAGFEYIGNERVNKIMESAQYRGLDLLVHFDCELGLTRQNVVTNTTTVRVYDVRTRTPIWESSPVNNVKVMQAWNDLSLENPFDKMQLQLQEFLDSEVKLDFTYDPTVEQARALSSLESFTGERPDWARALECRELFRRGLISRVEYQQAFAAACKVDWQAFEAADMATRLDLLLKDADPSVALAARDAMTWVPQAQREAVTVNEDEGS